MASLGRTATTRGALLKLRTTFKFVQGATEILKMKRDRLAADLNELLNELSRRGIAEQQLMEVYTDLRTTLATIGYSKVFSQASSISKMKVEPVLISIMGVPVPKFVVTEKSGVTFLENMSIYRIAERQQSLIEEFVMIAQIEANIERIAYDLMGVNRKVNALEKIIVPSYEKQIRYIEESLFDEELEEFGRIKHLKVVAERKKE